MCVQEAEERGDIANQSWIVKKTPPLCQFHKHQSKPKKPTTIPKQRKAISRKKKPDDFHMKESEVFFEIWNERDRVSFVTGKTLPDVSDARAWYFSHVLAKGKAKYPMFKYYKKNIVLKTFEEHEKWEYRKKSLLDIEDWIKVFNLENELKIEYEQHKQNHLNGTAGYYRY